MAELAKLKKVMAQQFLEEGRDKYGFVTKDGKLLGGTTYLYGKVVAEFIWNSYWFTSETNVLSARHSLANDEKPLTGCGRSKSAIHTNRSPRNKKKNKRK